jgi:hypothetical protein
MGISFGRLAPVLLVCWFSVTVVGGLWARALVWSRLCSFGRRGLVHCGGCPIGKGVGLVSPLFLWSAWAKAMWRPADKQGRWSGLTSVLLVCVGSVTVVADR